MSTVRSVRREPSPVPARRADAGGQRSSGTDAQVETILARLPEMERRVLDARFGLSGGHPMAAGQIGELLGLTSREAMEIERRALGRLRALIPAEALAAVIARLTSER